MHRLTWFGLILAAVALWFWPVPTLADPAVPYKDRASGTAVVTPISATVVTVRGVATGQGTHVGRFTVDLVHTLTFQTPTSGSVSGSGTYRTPGGASLSATYSGTFTTTSAGRVLTLNVVYQGGTGHLARVFGGQGTSAVDVTVTGPTTAAFVYTSTGTLTFR